MRYKISFCMMMVIVLFYFTFACEENDKGWKAGEKTHLALNENANLKNTRFSIKFQELVEDSRCTSDANCGDKGRVEVAVRTIGDLYITGTFNLVLKEGEPEKSSVILGDLKITLPDVLPFPSSQVTLPEEEYQIVVQADKI